MLQAPLQILDGLRRLAEARGQFREYQPPRQTPELRISRSSFVELVDGILDPRHALKQRHVVCHPRLHRGLQRPEEGAATGLLLCEPPKVLVALPFTMR